MVNKNQSMIPYIHLELVTKYENKQVEKLQSTTLDCGIPRTQLFKKNSYTHIHTCIEIEEILGVQRKLKRYIQTGEGSTLTSAIQARN